MSDSFSTFHYTTPNSTLNSVAAPTMTTTSSMVQPCCICYDSNHLLSFNPHADEGTSNTGFNVKSQQSSRWSPTPVQLLVLEELYKQGTKTPSSEQIHQIASQLRQFGKIEGKNVFYWFQNHKARERQKRRRLEMEETACTQGLKGTGCGVKETKKWASTSNCSGHAEEPGTLDIAEKGSNWWTQIEERGIHVLRTNTAENPAKCPNMEMPCLTPITTEFTTYVAANTTCNTQHLTPQHYNLPLLLNKESFNYYDEENAYPRTLELFPLKRDGQDDQRKSRFYDNAASMDTEITSNQFFEFLPLRN
ncbi:hypothetical protein Lal_00007584 [Lupinus albus]|uniref:Putative transcription factor homeobox-WOX family n=1 Tax=Lupinus albus TaxID=3870 RepID=A0A6A4PBZ2_LUPAL|nr:putative transcription factor homeobox-WOX family [Lupinus albus]KAF1874968.1 hypothetical protein Lal_00007584 [Lupinus albus]